MTQLTKRESEALLAIFKDFSGYYNANSISKVLRISRVGAMKIFKKLLSEGIIQSQKIGKSVIYKPKLSEDYVKKLIAFLLVDEANNFKRWKEEFKELFRGDRIVLIYGSSIKNYNASHDIDIMIVLKNNELKEVNEILKEKEKMLPKKLHAIKLTADDLRDNIKNRNKPILDIIKNAVVLYGEDKYVGVLKDVTGF